MHISLDDGEEIPGNVGHFKSRLLQNSDSDSIHEWAEQGGIKATIREVAPDEAINLLTAALEHAIKALAIKNRGLPQQKLDEVFTEAENALERTREL